MQSKRAPMIVTPVIALLMMIPLLAQQPGAITLPEGEGAELVRTSCVGCHSMERTLNRGRSTEGWKETINGMIDRGARIPAADAEIIINYLAEHFGVDFVPPREQRILVWVDRQGREEPLPLPPQHYYLPRLSPDAQRIAVEVHRVKTDIWIYDIPTSEMRQLTHEGTNRFPLWSPDGQRVLFSSDRHQDASDQRRVFFNDHDVYWKSADGSGEAERLTYGKLNHGPQRWTPDGKTLSFYEIHPETGRDIWMLPFEGDRKPWLFLKTPVLEGGIAFSADGKWMAHTSEEPGQREIVVRAFPQAQPMYQVSRGGGIEVVWPRRSRELFYRFGNKRMAVEITTSPALKVGNPRVLFEGDYVNSPGSRASWDATPDGQRFLLLKKVEGPAPSGDSNSADAALSGIVRSPDEGEMEGVLVTAKGVGGSVAVTVVTDEGGRYAFPQDRLQPGPYRISIRAVGYDLEDPGTIEVRAGGSRNVNLELRPTRDPASQLSNLEWLLSVPGTEKQRNGLGGCVGCHPIAFALKSTHDAAEWRSVLHRMRNYASPSFWLNPIKWPWEVPPRAGDEELAEYLSSINLSSGPERKYELKTLPRPKGVSTRVIMTEYNLPRRNSQPHDASVAPDGMVWYSDFGLPYLGRLNPRTGETREWRIPVARAGAPEGSLGVKFDAEGNPWVGLLLQRSVAKFDVKTETFKTWAIPEEKASERSRAGMVAMGPEGKVWLKTSVDTYGAHLLDPSSGEITTYPLPVSFYGTDSNSKGDLYLASLSDGVIGEVIARTGKVTVYPTPTPSSGSRRGHVDDQDRFWFAEFFAHQIGMFDTNTKQFQEWPIDTPWAGPYDAIRDGNGYVWAGGMHTDLIYRLNPVNGEVTKYLIPTLSPNFRNIDVDSSTDPVSVWLGANHQAKIIRVEPLD